MSAIELPAPLVPAWIDLRSYDWFPFYHKRLRQSEFWKSASDLACRISVDLWSEAYEQVPAGSIPNNDYILSEWAGFGRRDLTGWLAVKNEVLSAWTLCSDGRWYHRTLGEVACHAGVERRRHQWMRECDRIRKENIRRQKAGLSALEAPPKPSDDPWQDGAFASIVIEEPEAVAGRPADVHEISGGRPAEGGGNPPENALTETETETKKEERNARDGAAVGLSCGNASQAAPGHRRKPSSAANPTTTVFDRFWEAWPHKVGRPAAVKAFAKHAERIDDILAGVQRYIASKPVDRPWLNPATFLNQERWADQPAPVAKPRGGGAPAPVPVPDVPGDPMLDFPGGCRRSTSFVRCAVANHAANRRSWPLDLGPPPGAPGCLVPAHLLAAEQVAA